MSPRIKLKVLKLTLNWKLKTKNSPEGFTLIELLVVVTIIGILAGIAFALLNPAALLGQGKDAKRKSDLKQIQNALQQYYNDYKCYPSSGESVGGAWINVSVLAIQNDDTNNPALCQKPLVPNYLKQMPTDPSSDRFYEYIEPNGGVGCPANQVYALRAQMDGTVTNNATWSCGGSAGLTGTTYLFFTSD